jgi:predicted metal-binding protein
MKHYSIEEKKSIIKEYRRRLLDKTLIKKNIIMHILIDYNISRKTLYNWIKAI